MTEHVSAAKHKVLAVDDDDQFLQVLRLMLSNAGMEVVTAPRGDLGLERYIETRPDLVLLDSMMPGLDGPTLCRRIKALAGERYTPVILVTAVADVDSKIASLGTGADDYLQKPIATAELLARVRAHLRIRDLYTEVLESRQRMRELDRSRARLLASISHELRTPLHGIRSYTSLLDEDVYGPLLDPQRRAVAGIQECAALLSSMVESLLDLATLEARTQAVCVEPVDLARALSRAGAIVAPIAERKGLALGLACEEDATVLTDAGILHQILVNLLGNAAKYTERGRIDASIARTSGAWPIEIAIRDTGPGIDEDRLRTLFDGPVQEDPSAGHGPNVPGRLGFGLAIVRRALELIQGGIEARSRRGEGTTVFVRVSDLIGEGGQS